MEVRDGNEGVCVSSASFVGLFLSAVVFCVPVRSSRRRVWWTWGEVARLWAACKLFCLFPPEERVGLRAPHSLFHLARPRTMQQLQLRSPARSHAAAPASQPRCRRSRVLVAAAAQNDGGDSADWLPRRAVLGAALAAAVGASVRPALADEEVSELEKSIRGVGWPMDGVRSVRARADGDAAHALTLSSLSQPPLSSSSLFPSHVHHLLRHRLPADLVRRVRGQC